MRRSIIRCAIKKPRKGLVFNWFVQILHAASTSASAENKYTLHRHFSHCAPFSRTMPMVLVAHSAGSVVGSSTDSSIAVSTMRTSEHSRFGAL